MRPRAAVAGMQGTLPVRMARRVQQLGVPGTAQADLASSVRRALTPLTAGPVWSA